MRLLRPLMLSTIAALGLTAVAARAQAPTAGATPQAAPAPAVEVGALVQASGTVQKVNLQKRELVLRNENGKTFTVKVPEGVKRLDNVKPGDKLDVAYYESVAVSLRKPGEAPSGTQEEVYGAREPGKLPGGAVVTQTTATATIQKADPQTGELTIQEPDGTVRTIHVKDEQIRAGLQKLKPGERIVVTYTEAVATQVTKK